MQWVIEQTVDLQHAIPHGAWPEPLAVTGDSQAHEWRVRILENGAPAALDGCSCKGYFVRGDGQTVLAEGSIAEAIAAVVLPQACYAVPGAVRGLLRISRDGVIMTAAVLSLHVLEGPGDAIVDPGEVIPSLDELLAQVAAMEALNDGVSAAEAERVAAEQARVSAEEGREEAEDARASAESGRASAEQARKTAEQARAAAEAERVANEDERQQQLTNAINAAEADADRAEAAADAAETLIAMPPLFSNTPPTEALTLNKLWVDTGVSPTMMRRWRGVDGATTAREYQETHVGRGKNIADVVSPYQVASQPPDAVVSTITPGSIEMSVSGAINNIWAAWRIWWPAKPGKNYTISVKMECDDDSYTPSLGVYTKTGINGATQVKTALTSDGSVTVNTNDNDLIGLYLHFTGDTGTSGARTVRYYDIQIEEGSAATDYEPYHDIPFLALGNAQGQIESVALEMGCVANQAGTGDPSPENIRAISGHESVEIAACGKNLFPPMTSAVTAGDLTISPQANGTVVIGGTAAGQLTTYTYTGMLPDGQYTISGGADNASVSLIAVDVNNLWKRTIAASWGGTQTFTLSGLLDGEDHIRMMIQTANDSAGQTFDNVVLSPQLERGDTATAFEPYRSMGGGTVTPTEPLYGLPGAEDTVEISTDGDVLVTRRTGVAALDGTENWIRGVKNGDAYYWRLSIADIYQITTSVLPNIICSHYQTETPDVQWGGAGSCISQNYTANMRTEAIIYDTNYAESDLTAWKSYLAAQAAAGTPVTIVYELAEPETEALTAISPIAPQAGQLNLTTDADALTATIYGSGWDTIGDQTGLLATIAQLAARVAALEQAEVNTINTTEG